MNPELARLLIRLYPRYWRDRYGEELEALLQTRTGGLRTSVDVIWSALCEYVSPTPGLNRDPWSVRFHAWCVRAPWAIFGLGPIFLLATTYLVACFILWSGWRMFLPGSNTPFVPLDGYAVFYFGAGKLVYYAAPIFVGWVIVLIAARQSPRAVWPSIGLVLIALIGGTAQIHARRPAVPGGLGQVSTDLAFGSSLQGIPSGVFHALIILSLTMLPYLICRLLRIHSFSG